MTELTLAKTLGLRAPAVYRVDKKILPVTGVDPDLLYGVELEVEGLDADEGARMNRVVAGMQYHKDGSLRNHGAEFVTLPMNYSTQEYVLNQFFQKNKLTDDNYSERCSVHVHANCQDLTPEQIRLVLCLYLVLEKVLFNYIKADRDNNIFCVPLNESSLVTRLMHSSKALIVAANRRWRKYSAVNLLPLYTQGTLEFRHMAGTRDLENILQWLNIIGSLFKFTREHTFQDTITTLLKLNTSSAYSTFMQSIFNPELYDALAVGPYRKYLEDGVINMKVSLANSIGDVKENVATNPVRVEERTGVNLQARPLDDVQEGNQNALQVAQERDPRLPPINPRNPHDLQREVDRLRLHTLQRQEQFNAFVMPAVRVRNPR